MLKLGKPKATFNKAVAEIDEYINDPTVRIFTQAESDWNLHLLLFLGIRDCHDSGSTTNDTEDTRTSSK